MQLEGETVSKSLVGVQLEFCVTLEVGERGICTTHCVVCTNIDLCVYVCVEYCLPYFRAS